MHVATCEVAALPLEVPGLSTPASTDVVLSACIPSKSLLGFERDRLITRGASRCALRSAATGRHGARAWLRRPCYDHAANQSFLCVRHSALRALQRCTVLLCVPPIRSSGVPLPPRSPTMHGHALHGFAWPSSRARAGDEIHYAQLSRIAAQSTKCLNVTTLA